MPVHRQHDETAVHELAGGVCGAFIAVSDGLNSDQVQYMYILVDCAWYRFFLDAGLLFWDDSSGPDVDNDLTEDNDEYVDLGVKLKVKNAKIQSIIFSDGKLSVEFLNKAKIVFFEVEDDTIIVEVEMAK